MLSCSEKGTRTTFIDEFNFVWVLVCVWGGGLCVGCVWSVCGVCGVCWGVGCVWVCVWGGGVCVLISTIVFNVLYKFLFSSIFLTGSTRIFHDSPNGNYTFRSDFELDFRYDISLEQIVALISVSHKCRQFMRMETLNTKIVHSPYKKRWKQRSGAYMTNWGTPTGVLGCPCNLKKGKMSQEVFFF